MCVLQCCRGTGETWPAEANLIRKKQSEQQGGGSPTDGQTHSPCRPQVRHALYTHNQYIFNNDNGKEYFAGMEQTNHYLLHTHTHTQTLYNYTQKA